MKEGWEYKTLGECCDILDRLRKPIKQSNRESGSIPYYGATGLLDYVKDYIFDIDRFSSFEGDTGPYVLYTIVRIKSIMKKYEQTYGNDVKTLSDRMADFLAPEGASETDLCLLLAKFSEVIESAYAELAPHKICKFIYDVANVFNGFYHDTKILTEENEAKRRSYIALISLTKSVLETCIDLLGIKAPERM